ncbi:hypothetical protein ACP70R_009715 [Stipagrostis hirtigluma subsp. patula]
MYATSHVSTMSLHCSSPVLVLSLLLLSLSPPVTLAADAPPPSKPIVTRIAKDSSTSLYTIPVKNGAPLVLDLAGPLVWSPCPAKHRTVPCKSGVCKVAQRNRPANCASASGGQAGSGDPHCACTAYPYNPVSGQCGGGDVTVVPVSANATDGAKPLFPVSFSAYGSCAPEGLLASLPSGAAGVAGLSRTPLSLPFQIASRLKVAKQFMLCLPGRGQTGAAIFGGGPFELHEFPDSDLAGGLREGAIPFLKNPKNGAYYFRVHGIAVNQALVPTPAGAFDLDARRGTGGVTFSTVTPYTTLRPDIYRPLRTAFEAVTSGVRRAAPVKPFDLCYDASAFPMTRLGYGVANIDLMLDGGRSWTLPGGSSLVHVNDQTVCFAFLEMGSAAAAVPGSPAVIVGGFQLEDNMLLFDLEKGTFGISGLLWGRRTSCSNFDF